ncbi:hypothetical protein HBE96_10420 [Clostridium sp. P21]|uniref:Uncharacterized protein n=1 Tax=Clostridium muellerianum TaxID=2716538 RepID=A0A7Y0EGM7_9CLOT|nr:hypothetical protein [Clostridium muellerianum]NMM63103.1 hypothetical protein [Clostridium muellerianum]
MFNPKVFNSKNEMVDFISEYIVKHKDTIAIVNRELRKGLIQSLLAKEDFDKFKDVSNEEEDTLFFIKTGHKESKNLGLKVCDAYNQVTKCFKMVDIDNILIIDGLITEEEEKKVIYYEEIAKLKLQA